MLSVRKPVAVFIFLAALVAPASAETPTAVRTMMQDSGLVEEISDLGETFGVRILAAIRSGSDVPEETAKAFADAASRALDGNRFLNDMEGMLVETLSAEEVAAVSSFYRSLLGQKVKRLYVAGRGEEIRREIEENRGALYVELRTSPERLRLVERMDAAMLGSELIATLAANLMSAMSLGVAQHAQQGLGEEGLKALKSITLPGSHPELVEEARFMMQTSFARTHRDLSNEELARYVDFLETPEARAAYAAFFAAWNEILEERGKEIGEGFAAVARQKRS